MRFEEQARAPEWPMPAHQQRQTSAPRSQPARRGRWALGLVTAALVVLVAASGVTYLLARDPWLAVPFTRYLGPLGAGSGGGEGSTTRPPRPTPDPNLAANARMGCAFGKPPVQPGVIFYGANRAIEAPPPQEVALTFDDGPTPQTSPPILDYLEQTHTPATFMVEGQYVHLWPYLVQREWRDGFAVGVHTWDHPDMTTLTTAERQFQLDATFKALHAALGQSACIWFWRPPYGSYNDAVVHTAVGFGLSTVNWDVDPQDWSRPGTDVIVSRVLEQVHAGSIILMHDGPALREQTAAALPAILEGLQARGLTPVTLPKLLMDGHYLGVFAIGT